MLNIHQYFLECRIVRLCLCHSEFLQKKTYFLNILTDCIAVFCTSDIDFYRKLSAVSQQHFLQIEWVCNRTSGSSIYLVRRYRNSSENTVSYDIIGYRAELVSYLVHQNPRNFIASSRQRAWPDFWYTPVNSPSESARFRSWRNAGECLGWSFSGDYTCKYNLVALGVL